jgi:DNA-binding CsgD family transcriptional regulator
MYIRTSIITLGLFLPTCLAVLAVSGKYPITNFTPDEYKAGIQNIDFAQNRDMNLFVANNLGVLSFNGNEWDIHAYKTGKKQRSLAFDESSNRLYVGSQGDFGYFEHDWKYVTLINKIPSDAPDFDEVWDVYIQNSNIYFCTFQGIYVYDGQDISVIRRDDGFNRSFVEGNRLFTQSSKGELFEIEGSKIANPIRQMKRNQIVAGILAKDEGHLIFYNSGHIEYSTNYAVSDTFSGLAMALKGNYVNHILQLSDTRLVVSTQRAGLFLFDLQSEVIENVTTRDGLQTNACLRSFQDYTGNLWVGMQNGIALIDINSPLKLIDKNINLQGSGYEAFETREGTYYTTSNGIYFQDKNAGESIFLEGTEGPAYGMQMIDNKLYAGHHTGLFLLENEKAKRCAFTDGLWGVKRLVSNPDYAVGGTYSGLYLFKINGKEELEGVQRINGFGESSRFFEEDRKGRIWVCQYYKGLYQLQFRDSLTEVIVLKNPGSFNLDVGEHIILSRVDEELYLATDKGIHKIDQNSDTIIPDDLFAGVIGNEWVYLLEQDNHKNVHIFTGERVGFFKQVSAKNYAYIPSSLFQLRQTFNNDLLTVSKNVGNGVFYNANEGFIHYRPDKEERLTIEKKPLVSKIYSVAEESILYARLPFQNRPDTVALIKVIQGTKVLKFHVESFTFKDVKNRQFRYFLKGFDDDFGDWSNATFKEYTNLTEGNYQFFVQTSNHLGETVTSIPVSIDVVPPFYKSNFARVLYIALFFALLFLAYRLQRQYYRGKQVRAEHMRQKELAEKQMELNKLKEEKIESDLRHVHNLLAASTMNLVVKNEFMENIKEEIKEIKLNGQVKDVQMALEGIVKEIDTTLKVQDDWKQFEYHFDRVHGDFLTRLTNEFLDLTPGEQKLCAFLRLKMDTKEIANLMSISLRGVEVARYRLRKKLGLDKHQNLSKFILEY